MSGLLEGVRVIDLTHYFSGPYCTKLLATLGAEVIKIERPRQGDPVRLIPPFASQRLKEESGAWFLYLNTSKKSLTLDLKSDQGREILLTLVRSADILVENFSPGALDRLELGYETLQKENAALVVTSISNFGQTGPYRDWKAEEINLYAPLSSFSR